MANYTRTYTELARIVRTVSENPNSIDFLPDLRNELMVLKEFHNCPAIFNMILGVRFFNISVQDTFRIFRSNRYFWDAINSDRVLDEKDVSEYYAFINTKGITEERLFYILDSIINENKTCGDFDESIIDYNFLDKNGYLIIENALDHSLCDEVNILTKQIADYERNVLGRGYIYGSGRMQRVYSLISKHKIYQKMLVNPIVHAVMKHMFHRDTFHDKYYLTSFHANILSANAENQIWHIDSNVPDPIPSWIIRSNSNYITQDYTRETGATEIIPGSHLWMKKPNSHEAECGPGNDFKSAYVEAPKGSLAFWHGHLWHRSGKNTTATDRIALLGGYCASYIRESCLEENPYLNLDQNQISSMSDELKMLLGWDHGSKYYYF